MVLSGEVCGGPVEISLVTCGDISGVPVEMSMCVEWSWRYLWERLWMYVCGPMKMSFWKSIENL